VSHYQSAEVISVWSKRMKMHDKNLIGIAKPNMHTGPTNVRTDLDL
jgi:hypothetical protein